MADPLNITQDIADQIRRAYIPGAIGYKTLAKQFGVNVTTVRDVILGRLWNESGQVERKPYATPEKDAARAGVNRYTQEQK